MPDSTPIERGTEEAVKVIREHLGRTARGRASDTDALVALSSLEADLETLQRENDDPRQQLLNEASVSYAQLQAHAADLPRAHDKALKLARAALSGEVIGPD